MCLARQVPIIATCLCQSKDLDEIPIFVFAHEILILPKNKKTIWPKFALPTWPALHGQPALHGPTPAALPWQPYPGGRRPASQPASQPAGQPAGRRPAGFERFA